MNRKQIIEAMARALCISDGLDPDQEWLIRPGFRHDTHRRWETYAHHAEKSLTALETAIPGLADVIEGRAYVVHGGTLRDAVSCLRQNAQHAANTMDSPRAKWMNNSADHLTSAMIEARPK